MKVRCIYCGKNVLVSPKGFVSSHVTAGNQKCISIGSKASTHTSHARLLSETLRSRA
jgi:hypothetical protein